MTDKNIPAGYQVHVRSWENDGDNYKITITSGLSYEDTLLLVKAASLFQGRRGIRQYGNDWLTEADEARVKTALMPYAQASQMFKDWVEDGEFEVIDFLSEHVTGFPGDGYDGSFVRCVEWTKVYYIPSPIQEVTAEFEARLLTFDEKVAA